MEPIKTILSKEWPLSKAYISASLRSWQVPKMFSSKEEPILGCSKSLEETKFNSDKKPSCKFQNVLPRSKSYEANPEQMTSSNLENCINQNIFKSKCGADCSSEITSGSPFQQQARLFHKKTDISNDGITRGISSGVLSKEALLNRHAQRNASHFAIFDPAMAAINLSALQPSKAGFSVRKLISKSRKEIWDWGLPSELSQVKTEGPGINDNVIDFFDQKMRIQTDNRRIYKPLEDKTNTKIRSLMNKARDMNKAAEKHRLNTTAHSNVKQKHLYRTVSNVVIPNKNSNEPSVRKNFVEKPFRRRLRSFENMSTKTKESELEGVRKEINLDSSPTAYQPSASYKDVFYNIFNKTLRKPASIENSLAVFNRPALETGRGIPKPAAQSTLTNVGMYMGAKGKSEKRLDNEHKKSQNSLKQPSMKDAPRTPFQKVKDSLFTKSSKASFSTTSKTKINVNKPSFTRGSSQKCSTAKHSKINLKGQVTNTIIKSTTNQNHKNNRTLKSAKKIPMKAFNASYSTLPRSHEGNIKHINSKILLKRNSQGNLPKEIKGSDFNKQPMRTFFSYHGRHSNPSNKSSAHTSLLDCSLKELNRNERPKKYVFKNSTKKNFHTRSCTIFEPIEEQIFNELLNLCDISKKGPEGRGIVKSTSNSTESSCRCSLNVKKEPEKKKLICRLASMFNIGCGRNSKCPSPGCTKCGTNK